MAYSEIKTQKSLKGGEKKRKIKSLIWKSQVSSKSGQEEHRKDQ